MVQKDQADELRVGPVSTSGRRLFCAFSSALRNGDDGTAGKDQQGKDRCQQQAADEQPRPVDERALAPGESGAWVDPNGAGPQPTQNRSGNEDDD